MTNDKTKHLELLPHFELKEIEKRIIKKNTINNSFELEKHAINSNYFFIRREVLNNIFEYNEEDLQNISMINNILRKEMNLLYEKMTSIKNDFNKMIENGHSYFKGYTIVGEIYIIPTSGKDRLLDILTTELFNSDWYQIRIRENSNQNWINQSLHDVNWRVDSLEMLKKNNISVCYPLYCLIEKSNLFSYQDIAKLSGEVITHDIRINLINEFQ